MKSRQPYRNGRVHVLDEQCSTCIFRPGNKMHLSRGRVKGMVKEATEKQSTIICHGTLSGKKAVCRGFFDLYPTTPLQVAARMGIIEWQPEKENS